MGVNEFDKELSDNNELNINPLQLTKNIHGGSAKNLNFYKNLTQLNLDNEVSATP